MTSSIRRSYANLLRFMTHDPETTPDEMTLTEMILYRMFGRPTCLLGRLGGWVMASGKNDMTEWVVELLSIQPTDHVLEIGFGPGDGVRLASTAAPDGFVAGVDYSRPMVEMARDRNAAVIESGRFELRYGSAAEFPYEDSTFEKAFSINSMQAWPDVCAGLREIRRVLTTGGTVALAFTPHANQPRDELMETLHETGFDDGQFHEIDHGICAVATK